MRMRSLMITLVASVALAGCATKHPEKAASSKTAFAPAQVRHTPKSLTLENTRTATEPQTRTIAMIRPTRPDITPDAAPRIGGLAGRTLVVSSSSDIQLRDKEIILTFDDGPIPGRTEKVLNVLDRFNVKATFLMVGQMARNYSSLARRVATEGHTIGSHSFDHANLQRKSHSKAMSDIVSGDVSVRKATGSTVGFFRFPYLADTTSLRRDLSESGVVVLDVDIDSKDYRASSPEFIASHTMAIVRAKRKGIILMHDIHTRTAAMLPALLSMLKEEGYSVVSLQYGRDRSRHNPELAYDG